MDQKQIIHIASEVVVISGLAIYFKLKTSSLSTQVEELKKRIITQEQLIEDFKNRLDEHSLLFFKQEQLLKQCLKNQTQAYKQKSRSPKEIGIVWDSDNDSSYFPEKSVKSKKVSSEQKLSPPINKVREVRPKVVEEKRVENVRVRPQVVEEKRVENIRVRHRVAEERNRVGPPIIENLDEQRNRVVPPVENLDEELENELLELEKPDSEHSDSEIIEIDTSLKKKA